MFILCKGDLAKEPYIIPITEVPVYSLEEMCYYIYNNIYSVTEEFFDKRLVSWLQEQVHTPTLAKKMKVLIERGNDIKDLVVTLLCSCDYYKEDEIVKLVTVMEKISNLPSHKKNKMKADNYLNAGKYGKALQEYKKLIHGELAEKFSAEEYGNLLHNQAIAQFHVSSFHEATKGFKEAYDRNHNPASLEQYLYALLMNEQEEEFLKEAVSNDVSMEKMDELKQNYSNAKTENDSLDVANDFVDQCKKELRGSFAGGNV